MNKWARHAQPLGLLRNISHNVRLVNLSYLGFWLVTLRPSSLRGSLLSRVKISHRAKMSDADVVGAFQDRLGRLPLNCKSVQISVTHNLLLHIYVTHLGERNSRTFSWLCVTIHSFTTAVELWPTSFFFQLVSFEGLSAAQRRIV